MKIKFDLKELKDFDTKLNNLAKKDFEEIIEETAEVIGQAYLGNVVPLTPVRRGYLRQGWDIRKEKHNEIHVFNDVAYGIYVNEGHRQTPGRFIPGYWKGKEFVYDSSSKGGMVLKKGFVEGQHFVERALDVTKNNVQRIGTNVVIEGLEKRLR